MPVEVHLLPGRDLVLVQYSGYAKLDETERAVADLASNPEFRPNMRHLFDVSRVTKVEKDFARFFKFQAKLLEVYEPQNPEMMVMFYATTKAGRDLAQMAISSWAEVDSVVTLLQDDEAQALEILGMAERRIADLLLKTA